MTLAIPQYLQKLGIPAVLDRQLLSEIFSGGVAGANDLLVTSTGGARSVSVALGACYVPSTQGAGNQGTYRAYNDAALTRVHDPASTFPRLDQIVMRVYDSTTLGSGALDYADVEIVKGTEANGATVLNRTGAVPDGSLPANVIRLADVLVPVGASPVIPSANIVDRRPHAGLKAGGAAPIGSCIPYTMSIEPIDGHWVMADGRLIDKTVYKDFYDGTGHAYNNGADPLGNKVRIPDKRGVSSVGAISFGTDGLNGVVALSIFDNTRVNIARGAFTGERDHKLTARESGVNPTGQVNIDHTHSVAVNQGNAAAGADLALNSVSSVASVPPAQALRPTTQDGGLKTFTQKAADDPHTTVHPVQADNWIVRIA